MASAHRRHDPVDLVRRTHGWRDLREPASLLLHASFLISDTARRLPVRSMVPAHIDHGQSVVLPNLEMQQYDFCMLQLHVRLLVAAVVAIGSPAAEQFTGKVVGVTDGDTLKVMRAGAAVRVRLYGVDTPERKQPFATRARLFTSELAFGKTVTRSFVSCSGAVFI